MTFYNYLNQVKWNQFCFNDSDLLHEFFVVSKITIGKLLTWLLPFAWLEYSRHAAAH